MLSPAPPSSGTRVGVAGRLRGWGFRVLVGRGQRHVGRALDAAERAEAADAAVAGLTTLRSVPPRLQEARRGVRLRFVAVGLTALNAATIVLMLTLPEQTAQATRASTVVIAVLLGSLVAAGQLAFAVALGRRLREPPVSASAPAGPHAHWPAAIDGAALALLSTLAGWLIFLWARSRAPADQPQLGVLLALVLGLQAWVAPWLLVAETAGTPPSPSRRRAVLDHRLAELTGESALHRSTALRALDAARSVQRRAERISAQEAEQSGRPTSASWSHALRQLGTAITEAEIRCATLTGDRREPDLRLVRKPPAPDPPPR
ncbi:hypothetical protein [Pseudonocardia humida]|uniref:Uncharacterized protein n=1 Tax=Pseudonocardia humida TaxID=2800819 RepID=A0ABT1A496_9PSEU|nr:hypothetical protein [Pseudonocardia humida]MCO1657834.1 hypothetical protein [Pseudonocardia humida]